ncbi:MAG: MFS transporter [Dehalobacter sp. 4CP]|nr:MFS transporter [Dehalobacter sp. 4CP]
MNETANLKPSSYRWIILTVTVLNLMVLELGIFQIAGLANRLIPALHITTSQLAMLLTAFMLCSAIVSIPSGALADRFGVKNVVIASLIFSLLGTYGRMSANSFAIAFIWMFLMGFPVAFVKSNLSKLYGAWFPAKEIGMAMGLSVASMSLGMTIAIATSPLFPSVQSAFLFSAIAVTVCAVLWILLIKDKPAGAPDYPSQPVIKYLGVAAKSKFIWIGAIAMAVGMGTFTAQNGFLTNAFIQMKHAVPAQAGLIASTLTFASIIGGILGPTISSRVGLTKPFIVLGPILAGVCAYLSWVVPFGSITAVMLIITGLLLGSTIPLIMTLPIMLPEVGPTYAGSAGGIMSTVQMIGGFIIPAFVIAPLAGTDGTKFILIVAIIYVIFGLVTMFLPELGTKGKLAASRKSMHL